MALANEKSVSDGKIWGLCKLPFWHSNSSSVAASSSSVASSSSSSFRQQQQQHLNGMSVDHHSNVHASLKVSSVAKSLLPTRRRLSLDPQNKLYFPYEPGKQVKSAIRIKNISKNPVAFKFQTTGPKSCYMRPPGGTLAPDESLIATVFKFVEPPDNNEKQVGKKSRVKFKVMSLKVKEDVDYVPELFDERKDDVAVEQVLGVVFLDAERPCPALEKLNRQLAEAEAEVEARKRPPEDTGPKIVGEGLVIDEWKERRERYLARQQVDGVDSV
ncbi:vesicle-associated protein 4-2-like [Nicotiana tomentosiformis]|uniref:vesicle-associated protein 4-2-like n=1 Tax=Nicotiana tomentosiformis TaxID=4098 RepID=UPI00051BE157|nr:vesicle-associated protein 4-2-like [Nicotiana tomentosiformis]